VKLSKKHERMLTPRNDIGFEDLNFKTIFDLTRPPTDPINMRLFARPGDPHFIENALEDTKKWSDAVLMRDRILHILNS
jgi:hypothetical protein